MEEWAAFFHLFFFFVLFAFTSHSHFDLVEWHTRILPLTAPRTHPTGSRKKNEFWFYVFELMMMIVVAPFE